MKKLLFLAIATLAAVLAMADFASDYTQCSQITAAGNGGQGKMPYINTGFSPNQDTRIVMIVDVQGAREYWFGCWNVDYHNGAFACGNDQSNVYTGYDGQGGGEGKVLSASTHTLDLNKNELYVDGNLRRSFTYSAFTGQHPIFLFLQNRAGTPSYAQSTTVQTVICKSCQIYDNGTLVRNFVPAIRNSDDVHGMYDLVNDVFYTNAGTGELVCSGAATLIEGEATGYAGTASVGGNSISVEVTHPAGGANCTYEWSTDNGMTWSNVQPFFTAKGTHHVICRISREGWTGMQVEADVQIFKHDAEWTYDASTKMMTDGVWGIWATAEGDELTLCYSAGSTIFDGVELDLAKPVAGGWKIVAVDQNAFSGNELKERANYIRRIILPSTLRSIGYEGFAYCRGLREVTPFLPPSVTSIGYKAFFDCTQLGGDLVLGDADHTNVSMELASGLQFRNTKITSVDATYAGNIPNDCFHDCTALTNAVLSGTLTRIGRYAFAGCSELRRVTPFLPPTLEHIGGSAFRECPKLTGDLVLGEAGRNLYWDSQNDGGSWRDAPFYYDSQITSVTIAGETDEIPNDCFNKCTSITNAVLNSNTTRIGRYAFACCSNLEKVTPFLPETLQHLGGAAFRECEKLKGDLILGKKNVPLRWDCYNFSKDYMTHQFYDCMLLENVTIAGAITNLTSDFFTQCSALKTLTFLSKENFKFEQFSVAGWQGKNPQPSDVYLSSYAQFGKDVFRYHTGRALRIWVPHDDADWQSWVAASVDPWDTLGDERKNEYYANFGANAKKPVGLIRVGIEPGDQWIMWRHKPGFAVIIK